MAKARARSNPSSKRPDTAPKAPPRRTDPDPRPVNGGISWAGLKDPEPGRYYFRVNKAAAEHGVNHYLANGARIEILRKGGVRERAGETVKLGDEMISRGQYLMSYSVERKAEIEKHGEEGDSGQTRADEIEEQIIDKGAGVDTLRGLHGLGARHARVENESSPLHRED